MWGHCVYWYEVVIGPKHMTIIDQNILQAFALRFFQTGLLIGYGL